MRCLVSSGDFVGIRIISRYGKCFSVKKKLEWYHFKNQPSNLINETLKLIWRIYKNQTKMKWRRRISPAVCQFRIYAKDKGVGKCWEVFPITQYLGGYQYNAIFKNIKLEYFQKFNILLSGIEYYFLRINWGSLYYLNVTTVFGLVV